MIQRIIIVSGFFLFKLLDALRELVWPNQVQFKAVDDTSKQGTHVCSIIGLCLKILISIYASIFASGRGRNVLFCTLAVLFPGFATPFRSYIFP